MVLVLTMLLSPGGQIHALPGHALLSGDPTSIDAPRDAILLLDGPTVLDLYLATDPTELVRSPDAPRQPDHEGVPNTQDVELKLTAGEYRPRLSPAAILPNTPAAAIRARTLATLTSAVAERQAPAIAAVDQSGAILISTYDTATNALLISATQAQLDTLASAPGVLRVLPAPRLVPHLDEAAPLVGARAAETELGLKGRGVNIAIVDTGIDYTHCAFGAPGTPGAYGANDPNTVEPGSFPTGRVVGGYDFAGTLYGGGGGAAPDPDPLDENGHGTHVGSIAAGGCRISSVLDRGIAPEANIVALKIFGRNGSTSLITNALEWAIESNLGQPVPGTPARVDVLNMSLGNPWASETLGTLGAIGRATQAGIVIVASAGNSGPGGFLIGGPAADPDAIAVASTIASVQRGSRIRIWRGSVPEDIDAVPADDGLAPAARPPLRAPLVYMGRACDVDTSAGNVSGAVALIERGTCTFHEKLSHAQREGAVGAVVFDDGRGVTTMGSDLGRVSIPAYMISRADGLRLRDEGTGMEAELSSSFDGTFERTHLVDVMSNFSSRGPTRTGIMKPDISAPGSAIRAAAVGTANGSVTQSGTSMASPMVAGGAALVIESLRKDGLLRDPEAPGPGGPITLGAHEVAAMLINGADPAVWTSDNRTDERAPLAWAGAGRMDVRSSAGSRTLLTHEGTRARIDVGTESFSGFFGRSYPNQNVVRNLGPETRRYKAGIELPPEPGAGVTHLVDESVFELASGGSRVIDLDIVADAAFMSPYGLADGASAANGDGRLHEAEHDAWLVVTELGPDEEPLPGVSKVRMPIFFFGRPASSVTFVPDVLDYSGGDGAARVTAINDGGQAGQVELFTLLAEDGTERRVDPDSDVDLFGARVVTDGISGARRIELAIHTRGIRLSPYDAEPEVLIDIDQDGTAEWFAAMQDTDFLETIGSSQPGWSGRLVTTAEPVGAGPTQVHHTALLDVKARWVVLRLDAAALGYGPGQPIVFDTALTFAPRFGGSDDEVPDDGLSGTRLLDPLTFEHDGRGAIPTTDSIAVPSGDERTIVVQPGDPLAPDGGIVLALIPTNPTGDGDAVVLRPGIAAPTKTPGASATPSPTATSDPTAIASASPVPTATEAPTSTSEPTPNTTATSAPTTTPTSGSTPTTGPTVTSSATPSATTARPTAPATSVPFPTFFPTDEFPVGPTGTPSQVASPPTAPTATPVITRLYYLPLAVKRR